MSKTACAPRRLSGCLAEKSNRWRYENVTVILGINAFHADSAACLVVDGVLVGAVAEERLGARIKHSSAFPENAIRRLLADAGLTLRDVTHVAMARDPKANYAAKMA